MGKLTQEEFLQRVYEKNEQFQNRSIEILGEYEGSSNPIKCRCIKHDYIWHPHADSLYANHGCPMCGRESANKIRTMSFDEFNKKLKTKNNKIEVIGDYINTITPVKVQCENGHVWDALPANLLSNTSGCAYCSGNKAWPGETDIATTAPWMVELLLDKNDAYKYTRCSNFQIKFKCPICGAIYEQTPKEVSRVGHVNCHLCGDGFSYPNKLMANILCDIDVEYHPEYTIDGEQYRYDFYIDSINTIIEMHGRQHYYGWSSDKASLEEIRENDNAKYEYAINNGIANYIVIDSRESRVEFIKRNILDSSLCSLLDFSNVDWNKCNLHAQRSKMNIVVEKYNEGMLTTEIAKFLSISGSTVRKYLHQAAEIGLCDFIPYQKERRKIICLNNMKIYDSRQAASKSAGVSNSNIGKCCQHQVNFAGKDPITGERLRWMYLDDYYQQINSTTQN